MSVRVIERTTHVAPLGVRLWDSVAQATVSDGLRVRCRGARVTRSRSGVFAFWGLSGMREVEMGAGEEAFWAALPAPPRTVEIEVDDPRGRFLPCRFPVTAPTRGLAGLLCGSPPGASQAVVDLFSAPSRPMPAGMAAIRADLWDLEAGAPAAWALVQATAPGAPPVRGLADGRGQVAVMLPWPEPATNAGSPPAIGTRALTSESWSIVVKAFHDRSLAADPRPDLCEVLGQPPATLHASLSPVVPLNQVTLRYGRELVLRTDGRPVLALTPTTP